ncbi:MAG TPA: hypothetical protein VGF23_21510 [Gaiellaceae bacterium]
MPDVYTTINEIELETQEQLAAILELRAADPDQHAMLERYVAELELPSGARVLEVGCGTGAVCRFLAGVPESARCSESIRAGCTSSGRET